VFADSLETPPMPDPATCFKIESELAAWNLWMHLGKKALARHQQFRPRAKISVHMLHRMLQIGSELGRLACGVSTPTGIASGVSSPPARVSQLWVWPDGAS
jgi:hypothetical protein